jgi:methionyl-tRNA formyltransferase
MTKTSKTIVFFGSGPVAAKSLEFLIQHFTIEAVITKSVPNHHKEPAPVETLAKANSLSTFFANDKTQLDKLFTDNHFSSSAGLVVDYGVIISSTTINKFEQGIINSHFSLLPRWRGADPISFAVLSGDKVTGVSIMKIVPKLDEGDLISQSELALNHAITTPELTDKLVELSNKLLARDLPKYLDGNIKLFPQATDMVVTYSRKLTKADGNIDWHKPAVELERQIRAFIEWPKSRAVLANKDVIITSVSVLDYTGQPGQLVVDNRGVIVCCGHGALLINRLKPAGKREMTGKEFMAGYLQP